MLVHMEELLNLPEISVYGYALEETRIKIECQSRFAVGVCPYCLTVCSEVKMYYTKSVRDLAMNGKAVILALRERQFCCPECGAYFMERFRFVAPSRTMTERYEGYLYDLCERTSIKQVSIQENLLWDVVQEVFTRYAAAQLKQEARHQHVRWLGIDELALKKGDKDFVAVLVDLERACVIDVLEQRNKDFIIKYLEENYDEEFLHRIEVFSCDMWDGFVGVAKELMPNATIVIDRFHVVKQLHKAVNNYRKTLRKNSPKDEHFKRLRWVLLKHAEELSPKEKRRLEEAFSKCPQLEQVYQLKETFRKIFDAEVSRETGNNLLEFWIMQAKALNIPALNTFLKTLTRWKELILNYFLKRISNGLVEGINNMIKALKRQAYGYRNFQHFKLRILIASQ